MRFICSIALAMMLSGLEEGKGEKACLEQLRKDCKGVGIGKYCGMKHQH